MCSKAVFKSGTCRILWKIVIWGNKCDSSSVLYLGKYLNLIKNNSVTPSTLHCNRYPLVAYELN